MTFPPLFMGTAIDMTGVGVLAWALYAEQEAAILGTMALVGCGMGLRFMVAPLHGIGIFRDQRAAVIGLMAVAVPFGGTVGLTIMSAVFNNLSGLGADVSTLGGQSGVAAEQAVDGAKVRRRRTTREASAALTDGTKMGVVWAFVAILPFLVLVRLKASPAPLAPLGCSPPARPGSAASSSET